MEPTLNVNRSSGGVSRPPDIASLTSFRGILALWVVIGHFWDHFLAFAPWLAPFTGFGAKGQMAVPGFFILSGWVLSYNYAHRFPTPFRKGILKFWLLRLARIYPVHFVTTASLILVVAAVRVGWLPATNLRNYGAGELAMNLFLVHAWIPSPSFSWNYPSWSISAEWLAYLLFPFLTSIFHALGKIPGNAWFLGSVGVSINLWLTLRGADIPFWPVVMVLSGFLTGMAIHWTNPDKSPSNRFRWLPDLGLLAMPASCFLLSERSAYGVLSVAPIVVIWGLARVQGDCLSWWRSRPMVLLGEISYSLYLTHAISEKILQAILPPGSWGDGGVMRAMGGISLYLAFVLGATWACYTLVERPSRKALRTLLEKAA
ncbi:MAG TPA: acyltransferase [Fibrobacteria bacterium]|nr:acyltransferase [Fibrobacteria bacterium]